MKALVFLISTVVPNIIVATNVIEGCAKLKEDDTLQSIPGKAFWIQLRDAYVESVGQDESTIDWIPSSSSKSDDSATEHLSGFMIPYEVKITPGKGRSVHTKQFVPKGTPVWNPKYGAYFRKQEKFESFLTKLTWEQACDALQWCFAINECVAINEKAGYEVDCKYDDYDIIVGCSLDESSMINHGSLELGESNMSFDVELQASVALRDIQAGEELIEDYDEYDDDLEWFDNLIRKGWGDKTWSQDSFRTKEL